MTIRFTIEAARHAMAAELLRPAQRTRGQFCGVSIDSRTVSAGQAFVAITGDRFDGHDYCTAAANAGAAMVVVARTPSPLPEGPAVLRVADTRKALGALAHLWRDHVQPEVVAITGSMGKTTTKELTRQILERSGTTHATAGNFNNEIGLPLTIFAMPRQCRYLVVELGMNAAGEIATLAQIARPRIGLVTNVAPVHLEGLGSVEAIGRAKGELLDALPAADGVAVIPGDESLLRAHLTHLARDRRLTFGEGAKDRVRLLRVESHGAEGLAMRLSLDGVELELRLPLLGRHNASNAAAAAGVGLALGLSPSEIGRALQEPSKLGHRSALKRIGRLSLLDDCYNANPLAMCAALDTVVELAAAEGQRAVAVLGPMFELGEAAEEQHRRVGAYAATLPLSALIVVDERAMAMLAGARDAGMGPRAIFAKNPQAAAERVDSRQTTWVLVKASRGARLERVIDALRVLARENHR